MECSGQCLSQALRVRAVGAQALPGLADADAVGLGGPVVAALDLTTRAATVFGSACSARFLHAELCVTGGPGRAVIVGRACLGVLVVGKPAAAYEEQRKREAS